MSGPLHFDPAQRDSWDSIIKILLPISFVAGLIASVLAYSESRDVIAPPPRQVPLEKLDLIRGLSEPRRVPSWESTKRRR